jgi:GrpB-like predicted nucleotidyltransferase (UPF0157 family)
MLIQEYQEKWARDFKEIKEVINEALLNMDVSIEHVGSTSVPMLAAKPIIDIDVIYGSNVDLEQIKKRLEEIGYFYNGNQRIQEREVFKRHQLIHKHKVLDSIKHHLYVCPTHSKALSHHLLFRNFLIGNKKTRREYQQIKFKIAQEANQDQKRYAQLKEIKAKDFIDLIIERAKEGK